MTEELARPGPQRRRGLGRGLDALLGDTRLADIQAPDRSSAPGDQDDDARENVAATALVELDPSTVAANPEQPRRHFGDEQLRELSESIRQHGLLHPIVVERHDGQYRLVAGERRLRAAQLAQVARIAAIVRPPTASGRESLELALTENLARADLSALEEAAAYSRLADAFGLTHDAIALRLGKSRPAISNAIRLLALPAPAQEALADGRISAGHARALLAVENLTDQLRLLDRTIRGDLSVRAVEELIRRGAGSEDAKPAVPAALSSDDEALRRGFEIALGTAVQLQRNRRGGGRLLIDFAAAEDLDSLYRRLGGPPL